MATFNYLIGGSDARSYNGGAQGEGQALYTQVALHGRAGVMQNSMKWVLMFSK